MSTKNIKRRSISVPRGSDREDPNLFVGVNGVNYLIPRGKSSEVPDFVAQEIERSERARDALDAAVSAMAVRP